MEVARLRPAIALRGEDARLRRVVGHGAFDQEDVCLLAGLDDAKFAVDGGRRGDDPVGERTRAALAGGDRRLGGPALVLAGFDEGKAEGDEIVVGY